MQREFQRDVQALYKVFEFVGEFCVSARIDARTRFVIELTGEELFVNAVKHNPEGKGHVLIELERRNDAVEMAVTDFDADRFDPTRFEAPDTNAPLEQREGGLGIHLVKQMMDDVRYEYRDRTSRTIVTKKLG